MTFNAISLDNGINGIIGKNNFIYRLYECETYINITHIPQHMPYDIWK